MASQNILRGADGRALITDFGAARTMQPSPSCASLGPLAEPAGAEAELARLRKLLGTLRGASDAGDNAWYREAASPYAPFTSSLARSLTYAHTHSLTHSLTNLLTY